MKRGITILIADDHPVFRNGLRDMISAEPGMRIVAEAGDGAGALRELADRRPDVAVLGQDMPLRTGLEVIHRARSVGVLTRFVVLATERNEWSFNAAMDLGVLGYLLKRNAAADVMAAVRAAAAGEAYLCPCVSGWLLHRVAGAAALQRSQPGLAALTSTERRILKLVARDFSSKEIAAQQGISHRTIENHRAHIAGKLGLHGSHSLLKFALEHRTEL